MTHRWNYVRAQVALCRPHSAGLQRWSNVGLPFLHEILECTSPPRLGNRNKIHRVEVWLKRMDRLELCHMLDLPQHYLASDATDRSIRLQAVFPEHTNPNLTSFSSAHYHSPLIPPSRHVCLHAHGCQRRSGDDTTAVKPAGCSGVGALLKGRRCGIGAHGSFLSDHLPCKIVSTGNPLHFYTESFALDQFAELGE